MLCFREASYPLVSTESLEALFSKFKELGAMGMARRRAVQAGLPLLKRKENELLLQELRNAQ
jgi:hypothetical protein